MRIGELASSVGLSVDAVRFYEKSGLLSKPARSASGYRQYGAGDLEALVFIKRVQELGFSLREVREFVIVQSREPNCCPDVRTLIRHKLEDVRHKMAQLRKLDKDLTAALRRCDRQITKAHGRNVQCPVIRLLHANTETMPA